MILVLKKLGIKSVHELSGEEFMNLIILERDRRSKARALGRLIRSMRDSKPQNKARVTPPSLDNLGLSPALVAKLRAGGRPDSEIIQTLKQKGVI